MAEELPIGDQARIALAAQMRRGMHLLVARDPTPQQMTALAAQLKQVFDELDSAPQRVRGTRPWEGAETMAPPADGEAFPDSLDRPVSGSGNAFSIPMVMRREGDSVVSTVVLEAALEGAPGRSHGGFVSAIFDDLLGSLPMLQHKIGFTASLTIDYVAPSPVFEPVTFRGWVDRVEGKKIFVRGEAHHGDTLVTRASGLFIDATEMMASLYGA